MRCLLVHFPATPHCVCTRCVRIWCAPTAGNKIDWRQQHSFLVGTKELWLQSLSGSVLNSFADHNPSISDPNQKRVGHLRRMKQATTYTPISNFYKCVHIYRSISEIWSFTLHTSHGHLHLNILRRKGININQIQSDAISTFGGDMSKKQNWQNNNLGSFILFACSRCRRGSVRYS